MHALNGSSWLDGFFDDAAAFPPSSVPLDRAVAAFRAHQQAEAGPLVGNLVVPDVKLPDLIDVLDHDDEDEVLPVTLLVTGGAGAVGPAVRWASRAPLVGLRSIEVLLRDEDDLAHNAQRFLTALDACEDDLSEVEVFLELPRWYGAPTPGWLRALDEIAAAELGTKFRIGGADAEAVPSAQDLVTCIDAALDRELGFRCAGGETRAVTGVDPQTGATQHGYLNLLVATRGCLEGEDAAGLLAETSGANLLAGTDADTLARTRRWLRGVSTPSVLEAHDELVELALVTGP